MKMKKGIILVLVLIFALFTTSGLALFNFGDKPTVLSFASNPTTGYEWSYVIENEDLLSITDEFVQPNSTDGKTGVPGEQHFTFEGKKEGVTTVVFSYSRSFEADEKPLCTITYTVETDDDRDEPIEIISTFVNPGI